MYIVLKKICNLL